MNKRDPIADLMGVVIIIGLLAALGLMARPANADEGNTATAQQRQDALHWMRTQMVRDARLNRLEKGDNLGWAVGMTKSGIIYGEAWHGAGHSTRSR